ncbi:hypothetical protein EI989_02090, partial [Streptococcus suis]
WSDWECKTRTNLPINHCAEMLTRTLNNGTGLEPCLLLPFNNAIIGSAGPLVDDKVDQGNCK